MAVVEVGDTLLSLVISIVQTVKRFVRQLSVTREKKEIKLPKGNSTYDVGHSWTQREGGATYVYLVTICYEDADLYLSRCRSVWTPRWFGGSESRIPEPSDPLASALKWVKFKIESDIEHRIVFIFNFTFKLLLNAY